MLCVTYIIIFHNSNQSFTRRANSNTFQKIIKYYRIAVETSRNMQYELMNTGNSRIHKYQMNTGNSRIHKDHFNGDTGIVEIMMKRIL